MKLYIDPGTGSMLITVLIGIAGAAVYSLRTRIMKMKMKIGGGKVVDAESVPFAVFSDNGNTNGSARWMVKTGNTLSVDPDRNYFHFSGSSYYSNTNCMDRKITEKQYYDGINSIIKDYTKLKAISIK